MTVKIPKVPFTLYAIYDGFEGVELETVRVVRVTPTKWWFREANERGSSGLAFGCRTGCRPFAYHLSARAAWLGYKADAEARITEAQRLLVIVNAALDKL